MAETQPDSPAEQPQWEAARYEAALAHVERLQEQLDNLRSAIPSLVAPVLRPHTSNAHMFADMKKAAITSTTDLKIFRHDWTSEQTCELFARSRQSAEKDGNLSGGSDMSERV